jgi:hypothetical protein
MISRHGYPHSDDVDDAMDEAKLEAVAKKFFDDYKAELIEIGYEQASCNDEGLVDAGDALRLLAERDFFRMSDSDRGTLAYLSDRIVTFVTKAFDAEFTQDFSGLDQNSHGRVR